MTVIDHLAITVPVSTKEDNEFHLTLEEYLLALTSLVEELVRSPVISPLLFGFGLNGILMLPLFIQSRLAINSVTFGDYGRPFEIKNFISDLHDAFQLLNLKNDALRRRVDGLKYSVCFFWSASAFFLLYLSGD